jgi:hypothetical protein
VPEGSVHKQPNERLRLAIVEAALSNKALARAIRSSGAARGRNVNCDHTKVQRWIDGGRPRGDALEALCDALSVRLGGPVTPDDIGLAQSRSFDPAVGLIYPDSPEGAVRVLGDLWAADLDDDSPLTTIATNAGAWSDASLAWLVRPGRDKLGLRAAGLTVGASDIAALRATTESFATLDDQFGGRHARRAFVQFLRTDLAPLLAGVYPDSIGRELFAAASEATLLAAWMSYDAGSHGLAQRYFVQALRLAQAGDDAQLASTILDAMSHQATFLGRFREAATLARAAAIGVGANSTPRLSAHFLAMEARALAGAGDAAATERTLAQAVRLFEQPGGVDPQWIAYVDESELEAELAHCNRDIGRGKDAIRHAQLGLAHNGGSPRSDYFVTMVLAIGHLLDNDVEAACDVASGAITLGTRLKSARAAEYYRQFRTKLVPYEKTSAVVALDQHIAALGLRWA